MSGIIDKTLVQEGGYHVTVGQLIATLKSFYVSLSKCCSTRGTNANLQINNAKLILLQTTAI